MRYKHVQQATLLLVTRFISWGKAVKNPPSLALVPTFLSGCKLVYLQEEMNTDLEDLSQGHSFKSSIVGVWVCNFQYWEKESITFCIRTCHLLVTTCQAHTGLPTLPAVSVSPLCRKVVKRMREAETATKQGHLTHSVQAQTHYERASHALPLHPHLASGRPLSSCTLHAAPFLPGGLFYWDLLPQPLPLAPSLSCCWRPMWPVVGSRLQRPPLTSTMSPFYRTVPAG